MGHCLIVVSFTWMSLVWMEGTCISHKPIPHQNVLSKTNAEIWNMPNKLVKVLVPARSVQIRSTYYATENPMSKGRFEAGPMDKKTTQGEHWRRSVPLFKGPGIEGGIFFFCMGTLPSFLGLLNKGTPLCIGSPLQHKSFKLGICMARSWWRVAKVRLKNSWKGIKWGDEIQVQGRSREFH
jgi:hypothetical protein